MPSIKKKLGGRTYKSLVLAQPTAARKAFKKGGSRTKTMTKKRRFKTKKQVRNVKMKEFKAKKYIQQLADTNPWVISASDLPLNFNVLSGVVGAFNFATTGLSETSTSATATVNNPVFVATGDYRTDLAAAMYLSRGGAPSNAQSLNIDQIKWRFQIRNNGNIACNVDYYKLRERRSRNATTLDTFTEIYGNGLTTAGLGVTNSPLMLNPYKLDYITHRYVIKKKSKRLLPGEKWDIYYYTPVRGVHSSTTLLDRFQNNYTTYHGALIYGDPVHDQTTRVCTTAPCALDVIVSHYIKVKRIDNNANVNTTIASDNLLPAVNPVQFVSAFANATTAFQG